MNWCLRSVIALDGNPLGKIQKGFACRTPTTCQRPIEDEPIGRQPDLKRLRKELSLDEWGALDSTAAASQKAAKRGKSLVA